MNRLHHLYIHWPFCHSKCHYCDFVAFQNHTEFQDTYHQALCNEIITFAQQYPSKHSISTIFLGGGTPSLYPLPLLEQLFDTLRRHYDCSKLQEVTIEANPTDITDSSLTTWQSIGINRLSIGVQCLNDDVLQKLNRHQTINDVYHALDRAPRYIDNISIDLILGLPEITEKQWFDTLRQVVQWPIKHVSVYFLTVHEKTPLYFKLKQGTMHILHDEALVSLYEQTVELLEKYGLQQYEISNFAKPGFASLHNTAYWDRKSYKGFGIGASSFDGHQRSTNTNNLSTYLTHTQSIPTTPPSTCETIDKEQELLELLMLGLRQKKGVDLHHMIYFVHSDRSHGFEQRLTECIHEGFIEQHENTIRLTIKGMALENEVIIYLITPKQV